MGMPDGNSDPLCVQLLTKLFSKDRAVRYLAEGKVVFFAGGTGHPYFSTDTGVVLRAVEVEADVILLAKRWTASTMTIQNQPGCEKI